MAWFILAGLQAFLEIIPSLVITMSSPGNDDLARPANDPPHDARVPRAVLEPDGSTVRRGRRFESARGLLKTCK
jgi:hypothetical protein